MPRDFVYWDSNASGKIDVPLSYRAFARCLAFTQSRWSYFTLYGWLNIHRARERKDRDWFYCPVVPMLTWVVRNAGSSPCSDDDLIIHTKWNSSSKEAHMCWQAWWPSPALHKTSSLLTQRLTWYHFSPWQVNVSCLHGDLLASRACSLSQG